MDLAILVDNPVIYPVIIINYKKIYPIVNEPKVSKTRVVNCRRSVNDK